jgi:ATP-dependent RNA helicase DeaD
LADSWLFSRRCAKKAAEIAKARRDRDLERDQREPPYGATVEIRDAVNVNSVPRRDAEPGFFVIWKRPSGSYRRLEEGYRGGRRLITTLTGDTGKTVRIAPRSAAIPYEGGYRSELDFMTFTDLSLPSELIAALSKQQIADPSPIQIAAIPPLVAGKDAYLRAETGTGKTLAYLLPLFTRIDPAQAATQVVIVAPTHELAIQIHRQSCELALNAARAIRSVLLIGGTSTDRQIDKLKAKPHVVVGSPGRIVELIERSKLKMAHIRAVVIDEADRLLNDENLNWIQTIVSAAPAGRQLIFASATIEQQTRRVLETLAPDAVMLRGGTSSVNERIEHLYLICEDRDKPDVLRKLLHAFDVPRSIVFVHRNDVAEEVASKLTHHKLAVADLNSELSKMDRKRAMDGIRNGVIRIMIASDIAARGLDIPAVTHIFNLDVPTMSKAYLHRVGRTARAGAKGTAVSLVTETEARLIRRYEQDLSISLKCIRVLNGEITLSGAR